MAEQGIVRDIQQYQTTPEKEVFQDPYNFKGKAIDAATSLMKVLSGRKKDTEKKNYSNLYQYAREFRDETQAKGMSVSEFNLRYDDFTKNAAADPENYTPEEITHVYEEVFGKAAPKSIKNLIDTQEEQTTNDDEEYVSIGGSLDPTATTEKKRELGLKAYTSEAVLDAFGIAAPNMTEEDRTNALEKGSMVRSAMQTSMINFVQNDLKRRGGVPTPALLSAYKNMFMKRLNDKGIPDAAASKIVDNALSLFSAAATNAAKDTENASKYAKDALDLTTNTNLSRILDTDITVSTQGKAVKMPVGTAMIMSKITPNDFTIDLSLNTPEVLQAITDKTLPFDALSTSNKGFFLNANNIMGLKAATEPGSETSHRIDDLSWSAAKEAMGALMNMPREELAQNTQYNSIGQAYLNSHARLDKTGFTSQDYKDQADEAAYTANATTGLWDKFLGGEGMVMFDKDGTPRYFTFLNDTLVDSSNAGIMLEIGDNDAVTARNKLLGMARQLFATFKNSTGMRDSEIADMWNGFAIKNSQAMLYLTAFRAYLKDLSSSSGTERLAKTISRDELVKFAASKDLTNADIERIKEDVYNGNYRDSLGVRGVQNMLSESFGGVAGAITKAIQNAPKVSFEQPEQPLSAANMTQDDFLLPVDSVAPGKAAKVPPVPPKKPAGISA